MQRPKTLNTACSLALLQEEVAGPLAAQQQRGGDWYAAYKPNFAARRPLPQPLPPPRADKAPQQAAATPAVQQQDVKLAALKSYRHALSLCYKCGNKWSKDHRCPPEVLQAVDALWDSFSSEDSLADSEPKISPDESLMLALSKSTLLGVLVARTMRLVGLLQNIPVQILIDSGSSSSFVNEALVLQLGNISGEHVTSLV